MVTVGADAAGSARRPCSTSASRAKEPTTAASPSCAISAARNSKKPSSSSASRRSEGVSEAGSASSAGSTARTCTWSFPPKRSTRPSTRTASPSPKRWSSRSTSFQTRASTRPLASASSSARYAAPARVRRRSFFVTANTPSTVLSSASSAIVVMSRVYMARTRWYARPRWPTSSRFAPSATPARPARWPTSSPLPTTRSPTTSASGSTRAAPTTSST